MSEVFVLYEGVTEENLLEKLKKKQIIHYDTPVKCKSKGFKREIINILKPLSGESETFDEEGDSIGIVMFHDMDSGKRIDDIRKSTEDAVNEALEIVKRDRLSFSESPKYPNVYFIRNRSPAFDFVLHIAQRNHAKGLPSFENCTTDDYILDLAIRTRTIEGLKEFQEAKKNNSLLTAREIQKKIVKEIPSILEKNGITLKEAKGFVNLYIAVLQIGGEGSLRYRELPGKVVEHAQEEDVREVLESWIAAFHMIERDDS
jgi:hypothetical protein